MRRFRDIKHIVLIGAAAAAVAALALAGSVSGAPDGAAGDAQAWGAAFGDRPGLDLGGRMIVVLAGPSLAGTVAETGELPGPAAQRRVAREARAFQRDLLDTLAARGVDVRVERSFTLTFNGFSAVLDARAFAALARAPGVIGVYPVRAVYPAESAIEPEAGEPSGLALPGRDGSGVTVAVLDSGVDRAALEARVLGGSDLIDGDADASPEAADDGSAGHGTRMAGIVAGVAPGATILPIRILGPVTAADGAAHTLGTSDDLVAGIERAVDPDGDGAVDHAARVALPAVVEPYAALPDSPEARATAGAARLGTLVVAPAGNDGPAGNGFGTVGSPAAAAATLAVGALDTRTGQPAAFSSQGPSFDGRPKPDLLAPGVGVATVDPAAGRVSATGSSAAAALAAGAAALVAEARPDLDAAALHAVLVGGARPAAAPTGAGLLDPAGAAAQVVAVEPATVALQRGGAVTVRVRNLTDRELGVSLALAEAPALTADQGRLTLPAGGYADVSLRPAARGNLLSGVLVAQPDVGPDARLPFALVGGAHAELLGELHLSERPATPTVARPAVLTFTAGRVDEQQGGVVIEPVGVLDVELRTAGGKRLGVLARLRNLLPGRYSIGITGRAPDGTKLAPGRYVVELVAHPVADGEGPAGTATRASVKLVIR